MTQVPVCRHAGHKSALGIGRRASRTAYDAERRTTVDPYAPAQKNA
ncbi:hypothetical protein DND90_30420 [Pseudomonas syringae pv. maculicola]|nr:hypothetical protein DND90_30420 [Pseudomonas syringae pv. maculicola]